MSDEFINFTKHGALAEICLNRPAALNALNLDMIRALKSYLAEAFADNTIKSIWLSTSSSRAFCAGGDVKGLVQQLSQIDSLEARSELGARYFTEEYELDLMIEQSVKPIVCYAPGLIFGGGWGLFAGANLRLVSEHSQLCMPEIQIGFFPDVGAASFLQKNNWKLGTLLALTGMAISAEEAMALDYADDIISDDYAQTLKRQLSQGIEVTELAIDSNLALEPLLAQWKSVQSLLPDDASLTDWVAIIHREPHALFKRAEASMATGSPWSAAFTWHYFRKMRTSDRRQVLLGESLISAKFCQEADFIGGVTSKLIAKNNQPQWRHPQLESVAIDEIKRVLF